MKPQLYSIFVLLLSRINYVQNSATPNTTQVAAASGTQLPPFTSENTTSVTETPDDNDTSVAEAPDGNATSVTETPDGNATSVTETPDDVTSVTEAPDGNATSVTQNSDEATIVSEVPDDNITFVSEAPDSNATSAPSMAPSMAISTLPASHTTESATRITNSAPILTANQTSNPDMARSTTTRWTSKVITSNTTNNTVHGFPHSTKPTVISVSPDKTTRNRTSTFPVPSLFAITLLVISVLCF